MPNELHGTAKYSAVSGVVSADYTVSHGNSPGLVTIKFRPSDLRTLQNIDIGGDVEFSDGVRKFTLKNCCVTGMTQSRDEGYTWSITLYDRRWKWQFGSINGRYNERDATGKIRKETRVKVHEIAKRCFARMDEVGYDLGDLPNPDDDDQLPTINWEAETPAKALADLCDQFNCRIVFQPIKNRVLIAFAGKGKPLPNRGYTSYTPGFSKAVRPTGLRIVGAPVTFKAALRLKAMGQELDGSVVPIDDLSYKPTDGWPASRPPFFSNLVLSEKYRAKGLKMADVQEAARKSVYKWYRVTVTPFGDNKFEIPGLKDYDPDLAITEDWQIVPLPSIFGIERDENRDLYTDPPKVVGRFYDNAADAVNYDGPMKPVRGTFEIDTPRGLVMFSAYQYLVNVKQAASFGIFGFKYDFPAAYPAELVLVTSINLRDPNTKQIIRYTDTADFPPQPVGGMDTPRRVIRRDDITYVQSVTYLTDTWTYIDARNNLADTVAATNEILKRYETEYDLQKPEEYTYPRLELLDPDGAIAQVTWSVSGAVSTRASRNDEHATWLPPFKWRRGIERALNQTEQNRTKFGNMLQIMAGITFRGAIRGGTA